MSAERPSEQAAVNVLPDQILNPATSPLALAVDIPFKAAMLGLEWPKVRRLFDEREPPPPARRVGGARLARVQRTPAE